MADLWLGHLAADLASGVLPAILVFLKPVLGLSYTKTAGVVLVGTAASSVAQPLFGRWSDRHVTTWLVPTGVAVSATGIAVAPLTRDYWLLLVVIGISGAGTGVFHPEAMKLAHHASGQRRVSGMSVFQTGGNLGIAAGPLLAGVLLTATGAKGGLLLMIPGLLVAALLVRDFGSLSHTRRLGHERDGRVVTRDRPRPFRLLLVTIGLRSVAYYGLFTFVPLWEVAHGHSKSYGTALLSGVLFGGAVGTLCAGPLAERFGKKVVLVTSLALAPVLVAIFTLTGGVVSAVAVCAAGVVIVSTFSVTTTLAQDYLPSRVAMASGMAVGFAIGLGGIAALLLGVVADAVDLRVALLVTAAAPALGALVAITLPVERNPVVRPLLAVE